MTIPRGLILEKAEEIGKLVEVKDQLYGSAYPKVAECLGILFPSGIRPDQYPDVSYITRILEKLSRIASRNPENRALETESPFRDIVGVALCAMIADENEVK